MKIKKKIIKKEKKPSLVIINLSTTSWKFKLRGRLLKIQIFKLVIVISTITFILYERGENGRVPIIIGFDVYVTSSLLKRKRKKNSSHPIYRHPIKDYIGTPEEMKLDLPLLEDIVSERSKDCMVLKRLLAKFFFSLSQQSLLRPVTEYCTRVKVPESGLCVDMSLLIYG